MESEKNSKSAKEEKPQVPLSAILPLSGINEHSLAPLRGESAAEGKNSTHALTAERLFTVECHYFGPRPTFLNKSRPISLALSTPLKAPGRAATLKLKLSFTWKASRRGSGKVALNAPKRAPGHVAILKLALNFTWRANRCGSSGKVPLSAPKRAPKQCAVGFVVDDSEKGAQASGFPTFWCFYSYF
ncbi:hypothetical protein LR48_Vigan04g093900 [Vigna angularis]|uniref:Uncharacterized protein n=1 Tax=Phaseolus angularis TaxID=3914 RepID=A0A0L9UDE6_PHAAN|nr:hypothetical protein LR48_Vigan04g093900 [Vigna angularis]